MASSRRCGSWAYNWECLGPSGPGRAPPGPSPGTNPQTAGDMDRLTELHMVGLDGDQLDSLPESSGQLGWETSPAPSRLDFPLMRKLGAIEVAPVLPACAFQLWDETVTLGRTTGADNQFLPPASSVGPTAVFQ